jgi:hypothetical protein
MEEWLRAKLLATAAVTALSGQRIDWNIRPQGDGYPAVTLQLISAVRPGKMTGVSNWRDARVQIDCWARDVKTATLLRRAIADLTDGLRVTADGKKYRAFVIDESANPDSDAKGVVHRAQLDLRISYQA